MDRINDKTGENERNLTQVEKLTKLQICRSEICDVRALKKVLINLEIERIKEQCAGA